MGEEILIGKSVLFGSRKGVKKRKSRKYIRKRSRKNSDKSTYFATCPSCKTNIDPAYSV